MKRRRHKCQALHEGTSPHSRRRVLCPVEGSTGSAAVRVRPEMLKPVHSSKRYIMGGMSHSTVGPIGHGTNGITEGSRCEQCHIGTAGTLQQDRQEVMVQV